MHVLCHRKPVLVKRFLAAWIDHQGSASERGSLLQPANIIPLIMPGKDSAPTRRRLCDHVFLGPASATYARNLHVSHRSRYHRYVLQAATAQAIANR